MCSWGVLGVAAAAAAEAGTDDSVFESGTISSSISPFIWEKLNQATMAALDDNTIKLERSQRKRMKEEQQAALKKAKSRTQMDALGSATQVLSMLLLLL